MTSKRRLHHSLGIFPEDDFEKTRVGQRIDYGFYPTPLGRCLIGITAGRICYMAFVAEGKDGEMLRALSHRWPRASLHPQSGRTDQMVTEIFNKGYSDNTELQLVVRGTPFQVEVWRALLRIPTGTVQSYAQLARSIGRPKATRAVGSAIGANPIAWLIPCHRVIRSDGQIGGYRWGTAFKEACLAFEKQQLIP